MSKAERGQWVAIFNATVGKEGEAAAFKKANGVLKSRRSSGSKEIDMAVETKAMPDGGLVLEDNYSPPEGSYEDLALDIAQQYAEVNDLPQYSVYTVATFDDYAIVCVYEPWPDTGMAYYEVAYTMGDDGEPTIGECNEVVKAFIRGSQDDDDDDTSSGDGDTSSSGDDEQPEPNTKEFLEWRAKMARAKMPKSSFAYVDSKGGKHLPIHDAAHVRNALARFDQTHFESDSAKKSAKRKIDAAAKRLGVQVGSGSKETAAGMNAPGVGTPLTDTKLFIDPNKIKRPKRKAKPLVDTVKEFLGFTPSSSADGNIRPLLVYKTSDGLTRWFCTVSAAVEDKQHETLTTAAHKEYVEWADTQQAYPELWLWHTKGTRWGQADWLEFANGFLLASGTVDKGYEPLAETLADEEVGISHGFLCTPADPSGLIHKYRSFEVSVLPRTNAAVPWTDFNLVSQKENNIMAFTAQKRQWLLDHGVPDETVKSFESATESMSSKLKDLGIEFKDDAAAGGAADGAASGAATTASAGGNGEAAAAVNGAGATQAGPVHAATAEPLVASIKTLTEVVGSLAEKVKAIEVSDDEKFERKFKAAIAKNPGYVASRAADNITDANETRAKEDDAWFDTVVMGKFGETLGIPVGGDSKVKAAAGER